MRARMRMRWDEVVDVIKDEVLPAFEEQGVKPTLRTIFYALVSREAIPNTQNAYNQLSRVLVRARMQKVFPWDFIEDRVRYVFNDFCDERLSEEDVRLVEEWCGDALNELSVESLLAASFDRYVPPASFGRWAEQPVVPEVWVEKDALAPTLRSWLADLEVNVRVCRGYSSWTFIYENVKEPAAVLERHERVVILYCGDLDPSGVDIQRFLHDALSYFGVTQRVETVSYTHLTLPTKRIV